MKKNVLFLVILVSVVLLTGCNKEEIEHQSSQVGIQTLTASIASTPQTRVGFDGESGAFFWTKNDKIGVTTSSAPDSFQSMAFQGNGGETSGTFSGSMSGTIQGYAVYPYSEDNSLNLETNELTYNLPTAYSYSTLDAVYANPTGNSHNAAMWARIESGAASFKHLAGVVAISVSDLPSNTPNLVLTFTSKGKKITGQFTANLSNSNPVIETISTEGDDVVTINFSTGEAQTQGHFYIPVPIGTYERFIMKIKNGEEEVASGIWSNVTVNRRSIKRASVGNASIEGGEGTSVVESAEDVTEAIDIESNSNTVIVTGEVADNTTITLPDFSSTGNNDQTVTIILKDIVEEANINFVQEGSTAPQVVLSIPDDVNSTININLPNSTVNLVGGANVTYGAVNALTANNTLVVESGVSITTLNIQGGNVRVEDGANITNISRDASNQDDITYIIFEGELPTQSNTDTKIIYISSADYGFMSFLSSNPQPGAEYVLEGNITVPTNTVIPAGVIIDGADYNVSTDCTVNEGIGKGVFQLAGGTVKNLQFVSPNTQYDIIVTAGGANVSECNFSTPTSDEMGKGKRAIFTGSTELEGNLSVVDCIFDDKVYAFNFSTSANNMTITFDGCTLGGWLSGHGASHTFTNCTFVESGDYANYIPYCDASFTSCEFVDGFNISLAAAANNNAEIVFDDNSTYGENEIVDPADVQWDLSGDSEGCKGKAVTIGIGETEYTITICATDDDEIKYLHGPYEDNDFYLVPEVTVSGTDEIAKMREALSSGAYIKMVDGKRILADPIGGACFVHTNKSIIDGQNGYYIWANNVDDGTCTIKTSGGILKNLEFWYANKAIYIVAPTSKIILDNVIVSKDWSAKYAIHCDSGNNHGLEATNCKFYAFIAYAQSLGDVKFTGCEFGPNEKYTDGKGLNAYAPTEFVNCEFKTGYFVNSISTCVFENCTLDGVAITTENLSTLVTSNIENASVR